jgi:aldose 1-epimerase
MTAPQNIELRHESGATASVLAGFGFNCYDWSVPVRGQPVQALWQHPDFAQGNQRPSGSGIPLLFPFPGRIAGGVYSWDGKNYELPANDGRGNAIHGFVHNRPWRVLDQNETSVTGEFHAAIDAPEVLELWPADFRIKVRISLGASDLALDVHVDNPSDRPLPCGFGAHPYYRVPLGSEAASEVLVALPVRSRWELVELLPTGRRLSVDDEPLRHGTPFGPLQFDDAFTDLIFDGEWTTATLNDPGSSVRLCASYDRAFRECVVYTPPHREAICIEPLTCVPGAITLQAKGLDAGLRVLEPGESLAARMRLKLVG